MAIFVEKLSFINFLDFPVFKFFGIGLVLGWVLKIQDWICIVKYHSPLISVGYLWRQHIALPYSGTLDGSNEHFTANDGAGP